MNNRKPKVMYMAAEIPSLSETFVYNEMMALEETGASISVASIRQPASPAESAIHETFAEKTFYIYSQPVLSKVCAALKLILLRPYAVLISLIALLSDIVSLGTFNRVAFGQIYRWYNSFSLARRLQKEKCDHLHVHFAHVPTDVAMYASLISGVPFSFMAHANDIFERGWLLQQKVDRSAFCATISDYNKNYLTSQGADVKKIHIIRCGIDASAFSPRETVPTAPQVRLGSLGRFVEKKGFEVLIVACQKLRERQLNFVLEIAGSGPLEAKLENLVHDLGLDKHVRFIGSLPHSEVAAWMTSLDLFVLACRKDSKGDMDGIPVVLMEAMSLGVPVLSTKLSGIPELIRHRETGQICNPESPEALADQVIEMMGSSDHNAGLVEAGVALVRAEFDISKNALKLLSLIKSVGIQQP